MWIVNWFLGVGMPLATGGAALAAAVAAYAYIPKIAWLPDIRTPVCAALVALGVGLISYSQGYSSARGDHAVDELRRQANELRASLDQLKGTTDVVANLQSRMSEQAQQAIALAAEQRAQTDDLLQQLQSKPVPVACDWSPGELAGVRSIRIHRPAKRASPTAR